MEWTSLGIISLPQAGFLHLFLLSRKYCLKNPQSDALFAVWLPSSTCRAVDGFQNVIPFKLCDAVTGLAQQEYCLLNICSNIIQINGYLLYFGYMVSSTNIHNSDRRLITQVFFDWIFSNVKSMSKSFCFCLSFKMPRTKSSNFFTLSRLSGTTFFINIRCFRSASFT